MLPDEGQAYRPQRIAASRAFLPLPFPERLSKEHDSPADLQKQVAALRRKLSEVHTDQKTLTSVVMQIHERLELLLPRDGLMTPAITRVAPTAARVSKLSRISRYGKEGVPEEAEASPCLHVSEDGEKLLRRSLDSMGSTEIKDVASDETRGSMNTTATDMAVTKQKSNVQVLRTLIEVNNQTRKSEKTQRKHRSNSSFLERLLRTDTSTKNLVVDIIAAVVITCNAIFIGFSADHWNGEIDAWCFIDLLFCSMFLVELMTKVYLKGFAGHFCADEKWSNIFDATLVFLDIVQLFLVFFVGDLSRQLAEQGVPSATLFRTIRIIRVSRILRVLRHPSFDSLLQMIQGILEGATTLAWALLLFSIFAYIGALLSRELLGGKQEYKDIYPYFKSVPRSMYTIFRCSFGDCNTVEGTPLPEFLFEHYGLEYSLFYSLFLFFVAIGLFNVISAIFVNTTLSRQEENQKQTLMERFEDERLLATRVCTIMKQCLRHRDGGDGTEAGNMARRDSTSSRASNAPDHLDASMLQESLPSNIVDEVFRQDEKAIAALKELDIDPHDNTKLADILDPDHSGSIDFAELALGLQRMRGVPRRSDIVTVDLMLRSAQEKLDEILDVVEIQLNSKLDQILGGEGIKEGLVQIQKQGFRVGPGEIDTWT